MEIDRWVGPYRVRAFPWIEKNLIYFNVHCYAPGQSLEKPPVLDQTVYITNDAAGVGWYLNLRTRLLRMWKNSPTV